MPKKSSAEKLETLKQRQEHLKNRIASLQARTKQQQRKDDARRKIIVGGAVLAHASLHADFAAALRKVLAVAVTRDIDKAAIPDLLDGEQVARKEATRAV